MSHAKADVDWWVTPKGDPSPPTRVLSTAHAQLAVLMDIRRELKQLNAIFGCRNFTTIPITLSRIEANTTKRKYKKKKKG